MKLRFVVRPGLAIALALCGFVHWISPGVCAADLRFGIAIDFGLPGKFLIRREGLVEASPDGRSLMARVQFVPDDRADEIAWLKLAEKDARYSRAERRAISELGRSLSGGGPQFLGSPYRFRTGTLGQLRELARRPERAEALLQDELTTLLVDVASKEVSFLTWSHCASWLGFGQNPLRN